MTGPPVAIIAGSGQLPTALARSLLAARRRALFAAMDGVALDNPDRLPVLPYRAEKLGGLFRELRAASVQEIVFAGAMRRPRLDPARFDFKTLTLAPRLLGALKGGDDSTLRMVIAVFEAEGFVVRGAHEIAPELLPDPGVLSRRRPSERDRRDAARAATIVAALAAADVGQGAVVAQGVALAVEAAPGTDRMLAHVAAEARVWRPDPAGAGGVLFKAPKRGQDRRIDLPAIGPGTIAAADRAGLSGVAIEAGGVMLLEASDAVAAADAAGLFLWVRRAGSEALP